MTMRENVCVTPGILRFYVGSGQSKVVVDAYPLDAVGRKLMFGARKGVTQEVLGLFTEHLENNLT